MRTLIFVLALCLGMPVTSAAGFTVKVTSYNPAVGQTDDSPCSGASSRDLCRAAKEGDRTIALSRDLLAYYGLGGKFRWRDKVRLTSKIPQCSGIYSVEDTMNERFTGRADIFFMERKQNTSCIGTLELITFPGNGTPSK